MTSDQLMLFFGPNERQLGKQFLDDPRVDESKLKLSQFSVLDWLKRFPHWHLGVRLMPAPPPPPGVATFRAAAISEGKDPDKAVQEARTKVGYPTSVFVLSENQLHRRYRYKEEKSDCTAGLDCRELCAESECIQDPPPCLIEVA